MPFAFPGKSLAYTRVDFTNPTGQLVAYGSGSHPMSSVASLTGGRDQPIRSTLAGQLDMRCVIFSSLFPMHLLDVAGLRRMSNSLKMGKRSSMEKTCIRFLRYNHARHRGNNQALYTEEALLVSIHPIQLSGVGPCI